MPLNLYDTTVPPIINMVQALQKVLKKGEAFANENNMDPMELTNAKLAPDMLPLTFQINTLTNMAKGIPMRVGGYEPLNLEDKKEMTFDECQERLSVLLEYMEKAKKEDFEGKEDNETELMGRKMTILDYVNKFAIPNFYFHVTTAYDILRHKGVQIGKRDFLGVAS